MKSTYKILTAILLTITIPGWQAYAKRIEMNISPQPMIVGEPARLTLKNHGRATPKLVEIPDIDGIRFVQGPSYSTISINGVMSINAVYIINATKSGKINIPALKVNVGRKIIKTSPREVLAIKRRVMVRDGGKQVKKELAELVYGKVKIANGKDKLYVGEEVPLEFKIYAIQGLQLDKKGWPELQLKRAMVRDYSKVNRQCKNFEGYYTRRVRIGNQIFTVHCFRSAFRPIAAGTLQGQVSVTWDILFPSQRRQTRRRRGFFNDSFFDDDDFIFSDPFSRRSRYDRIPRRIVAQLPKLPVLPLPEKPENAHFLGLVGDWDVKTTVAEKKPKVGEHFLINIAITGQGTLDTLKIPELKLPGFNVYPPEVEKKDNSDGTQETANIKYVVIPLAAGQVNLDLNLATFNASTGKYRISPFNRTFTVAKSDNPNAAARIYVAPTSSKSSSANYRNHQKDRKINEIFYLKKKADGKVKLPLWRNEMGWYIIFLLFGPAFLIICEIRNYRKNRLSNDPLLLRKKLALARRGSILRNLKKCPDSELSQVGQNEVVPFFNDILGMPPGTSATELESKTEDRELKECLSELSTNSFMPGGKSMDDKHLRSTLIKTIKRLSIFLLITFIAIARANALTIPKKINTPQEAIKEYNDGNFKAAAAYYRNQLDPDAPSPNLLYNLANCLYQLGDLPRALVAYERALRLAPRDSDILENTNLTRRKLFLPEVRKAENPLDLLLNFRDSFRPDQWLLATLFCWTLIFLIIAGRRRILSGKTWIYSLVAVSIIALLCLGAVISQHYTTYSTDTAIVVVNNAPVYSLPTLKNGHIVFKLKAGEEVHIEEFLNNWVLVRNDRNEEGWMEKNSISTLWQNQ